MDDKLNNIISLASRIDKHLTKSEAERFTDAINEDGIVFNVNAISPQLMEYIMKDIRDFGQNFVYGNPLLKEGKQYIKETYGKIYDADDVIKHLRANYHLDDQQFLKVEVFNGIAIYILTANVGENRDIIVHDMQKMGYFLSIEKSLEKDGKTITSNEI